MLIECPHCHVRVDPCYDEGTCPSCHESVHELDGINPNRALLLMRPAARMPELCSQCGMPTSRVIRIETEEQVEAAPVFGLMSMSLFRPLVALMNQLRRFARTGAVAIQVPVCDFCSDNPIEPVAVHPADNVFQCQVHVDFKHRYQQLNQHLHQ